MLVKIIEILNLKNVLHLCPYHIDSLIQLSEVSRLHDDTQMAAEFIGKKVTLILFRRF